jgi:hypothetical protein
MTDLFVRTQAEFHRARSEFLHLELAACSKNAELAADLCRNGNRRSAERTIAEAEVGCAELLRLMADPAHTKRLTIKTKQELTGKLEALRRKVEGLRDHLPSATS